MSQIREAADPSVGTRKSKNNLEQQSLRLDRRCHVGGDMSGDLCVATAISWGEPSVQTANHHVKDMERKKCTHREAFPSVLCPSTFLSLHRMLNKHPTKLSLRGPNGTML